MARIRIEEKKKGGILPWILGLLLLGLAVWGIAELFEESDEYLSDDIEAVEESSVPSQEVGNDLADVAYSGPVAAYMQATENMKGEMGLDHEFSHDALTKLAMAVDAVASDKGVALPTDMARVTQLADDITKDPTATDHADKIRMAALQITDAFEAINDAAYDGKGDVSMLRKEAQDISGKSLTLNQKEDVRSFFGAARSLLSEMK